MSWIADASDWLFDVGAQDPGVDWTEMVHTTADARSWPFGYASFVTAKPFAEAIEELQASGLPGSMQLVAAMQHKAQAEQARDQRVYDNAKDTVSGLTESTSIVVPTAAGAAVGGIIGAMVAPKSNKPLYSVGGAAIGAMVAYAAIKYR